MIIGIIFLVITVIAFVVAADYLYHDFKDVSDTIKKSKKK